MSREPQSRHSEQLNEVKALFQEWRKHKGAKDPIPEALWSAALHLSPQHSPSHISKALSIRYGDLKQRMQAEEPNRELDFIELKPLPTEPPRQAPIHIEILETDGARMTLQLPGEQPLDLAALVRAFRRQTP
jgi:hypothetical protein